MFKRIFILTLLVLVIATSSGCIINTNLSYITESETGSLESEVFTGKDIIVNTTNGSVNIKVWDKDYVRVEYEKKASSLKADDNLNKYLSEAKVNLNQDHEKIKIDTDFPRYNNGSVSIKITLYTPKTTNIDVTTSNGSINVDNGLEGNLKLRSSNGSINVTGVTGDFYIRTSNGAINIKDAKGSGEIQTSNGAISFKSNEEIGDLRLSTSNGRVELEMEKPVGDEYILSTTNGSITVTLPEDAGFDLEARTTLGSIKTDFKATQGKNVKEKINDGGFLLSLETSNGSISIDKK